MKNTLNIKNFLLSMLFAYLLIFAVIIPLLVIWISSEDLESALLLGPALLVFAIPIALLATFVGFPIFCFVIKQLSFIYFINVMLAYLATACVIAILASSIVLLVFNGKLHEFGVIFSVIGLPTIIVALTSGVLFWNRTK